jgi:Ca2+-binding RTX toxin-like protein
MTDFTGTAGNDDIDGTTGSDDFFMDDGGNDRVNGGGAGDVFWFGATFNALDRVNGGDGSDTLVLEGDYSSGIALNSNSLKNVETVNLLGDFFYDVTFADGNVAGGGAMTVVAALGTGKSAVINASAETNGSYLMFGSDGGDLLMAGAGDDVIHGGLGADVIQPGMGQDTVSGGEGDDVFSFQGAGTFTAADRVDGGAGPETNTLQLSGDYSAGVTLKVATLTHIQRILVAGAFDYTLDVSRFTTTDVAGLTVSGLNVLAGHTLDVTAKGCEENVTVFGGFGDDIIRGGKAITAFVGNDGTDTLIKGQGSGHFFFDDVAESTGAQYDTIAGFDTNDSHILAGFVEGGVDGVNSHLTDGTLTAANFDDDLEDAVNPRVLDADFAVLFTPDGGNLAGRVFLIVDGNAAAGYQAGEDMVVRLKNGVDLEALSEFNFSVPL